MIADLAGAIPDLHGINLYRADRDAAALFAHYLPGALFRHLDPHFDRLGALAGGDLDDLSAVANHNPPILRLRRRTGEDCNIIEKHPAYVELERIAFSEFGLAAMSTERASSAGRGRCRRPRNTLSPTCLCKRSSACAAQCR